MSIFPKNYSGLNSLYDYAKSTGLLETGSSSISPTLAESCSEVRRLMSSTCFLRQRGEGLNNIWAALGDESGILYFGGREIDGHRVNVVEHLEYLAVVFGGLSEKAALDVDKIALSFIEMADAPPAGPVFSFTKDGTFIIPPEVYKRNMTQEEQEPFRVERDDPRFLDF